MSTFTSAGDRSGDNLFTLRESETYSESSPPTKSMTLRRIREKSASKQSIYEV